MEAAALDRARSTMAQVAADLVAERQKLEGSVSGLLGAGWTGAAADEYRQGFADWRAGAEEVLASLHTMSDLMAQTRAQYLRSDDASVQTVAPVSSRLQERLS